MRPAVLFARADSIYKSLDCDVWDAERNALNWPGGAPIVAHPPCRLWSRLRHFSTAPAAERNLAPWAIEQARQWGGVVEHPASSSLWAHMGISRGGSRDEHGGFCLTFPQWWFGHRAEKMTTLYFCGIQPADLPEMTMRIGEASHVITSSRQRDSGSRPRTTKAEREHTPPELAKWLLDVASRCGAEVTA